FFSCAPVIRGMNIPAIIASAKSFFISIFLIEMWGETARRRPCGLQYDARRRRFMRPISQKQRFFHASRHALSRATLTAAPPFGADRSHRRAPVANDVTQKSSPECNGTQFA